MQATGHPSHTGNIATAPRPAQDRFLQPCGPGVYPLRPVTFQGYGAGAQLSAEDAQRVELTFPVDAGRSVRISVNRATAFEFARSLIETLGGIDAVLRPDTASLKRGCRRGIPKTRT